MTPGDGPVDGGHGHVFVAQLGVFDDLELGDGVGQVVLEQLFHLAGVAAAAAQEGGGLKGAPTGAEGEVLGVQDDAGQQGLRLAPEQV